MAYYDSDTQKYMQIYSIYEYEHRGSIDLEKKCEENFVYNDEFNNNSNDSIANIKKIEKRKKRLQHSIWLLYTKPIVTNYRNTKCEN